MPIYRYQAWDAQGRLIRGRAEAQDDRALYSSLKAQGLLLRRSSLLSKVGKAGAKIRPQVLAEFSHQMAFVIRSGIPLMQGMSDLKGHIQDLRFQGILDAVLGHLTAGETLSQAMVRYPEAFPSHYVSVIHAGETAGSLDESFRDVGNYLEWLIQIRQQIKHALVYPAIVLMIMGIAIFLFVAVVIPRLVSFIQELNRPMPLPTKLLVLFNEWLLHRWYLIAGCLAGIVLVCLIAWRFEGIRFLWDRHKLRIRPVGPVLRDLILLRFVKYLRVLYRSGIQIHQSFEILREVVPNRYFKSLMGQIRGRILEGDSLAEAMERVGGFTPQVLRSVRVGEQTGTLEEGLEQLGAHIQRSVDEGVKRLVTLLEPVLLMTVGVIFIMIIMTVLWPIYTILGELG
ncbi:MAG: type II secretion system F family protein [Thermodesulfobacteriota bacterium]